MNKTIVVVGLMFVVSAGCKKAEPEHAEYMYPTTAQIEASQPPSAPSAAVPAPKECPSHLISGLRVPYKAKGKTAFTWGGHLVEVVSPYWQGKDYGDEVVPLTLRGYGPVLVSIGTPSCPSSVYAMDDVFRLAGRMHMVTGNRSHLVFLLSGDDKASDLGSLWDAVQVMLQENAKIKRLPHAVVVQPWMELQADPEGEVLEALAVYCAEHAGCADFRNGAPTTLLLDRCGNVRLIVQNSLDAAASAAILREAELLDANNDCR